MNTPESPPFEWRGILRRSAAAPSRHIAARIARQCQDCRAPSIRFSRCAECRRRLAVRRLAWSRPR